MRKLAERYFAAGGSVFFDLDPKLRLDDDLVPADVLELVLASRAGELAQGARRVPSSVNHLEWAKLHHRGSRPCSVVRA